MGGDVIRLADPRVFAVCGLKDSGKTTLICRLVEELAGQGRRVAVIKHDGHDFQCDIPGTDTYCFDQAGACGTAIYSEYQMFVHKKGTRERELSLIGQFPEAEFIILEGCKNSSWPKIEVIRRATGNPPKPVSNPEGRFLIVTDWKPECFSEPVAGFHELKRIVKMILEQKEKRRGNAEVKSFGADENGKCRWAGAVS